MKNILILNGPNINMLGIREPEIYGSQTIRDLEGLCVEVGHHHDFRVDFRQSNHEGVLVEWIQEACGLHDGLIINAAAYTHTSIAIHDALKLLHFPIIEVHLSDPKKREDFRHISYIEPLVTAVFAGHGMNGYKMALDKLADLLS